MCRQLPSPDHKEEDPTRNGHAEHFNKQDNRFNVEYLLINLESIPQDMKDTFGNIKEFSTELEAAKIELLRIAKEEKNEKILGSPNILCIHMYTEFLKRGRTRVLIHKHAHQHQEVVEVQGLIKGHMHQ